MLTERRKEPLAVVCVPSVPKASLASSHNLVSVMEKLLSYPIRIDVIGMILFITSSRVPLQGDEVRVFA